MRHSYKVLFSLICLTQVFAEEPAQEPPFPGDQLPPLPPSVAYQPEAVTTQPKGLITPTVAPRVKNGENISIDADFIWWKAQLSNFDVAQADQKTFSPPYQFEPGFKVGTGMDLIHDGWDVYSEFTFLYSPTNNQSKSNITTGYSVPFSVSGGPLTPIMLTSVSASRKYQFNILDLEAGRNFFISKRLTLRPHIGLKGASLFEKNSVRYTGDGIATNASLLFRQNLSGVGTRFGLDTMWHITNTFGFYGDAAFTALWGSFHNNLTQNMNTDLGFQQRYIKKNSQDILPVFEIGIGLSYFIWTKEQRFQFYFKAGWEEQIWGSYNKNMDTGLASADGNLSLQGLTVKAGCVF